MSALVRALESAAAWVLALLFAWAALSKALDPHAFAATVASFGLAPDAWVPAVAWSLIVLEGGTAIVLPWRRGVGAALACGLLVLFLAVLAYGLHLGLDIDCGCFGPGQNVSLREAFVRDLVLLAVAAWLARRRLRAARP